MGHLTTGNLSRAIILKNTVFVMHKVSYSESTVYVVSRAVKLTASYLTHYRIKCD